MLENLDLFFSDPLMSVAVQFGDLDTRGILEAGSDSFDGGLVQADTYTLLVKTDSFPVLPVAEDLITVDGTEYEVTVPFQRVDDGKVGRIGLGIPA